MIKSTGGWWKNISTERLDICRVNNYKYFDDLTKNGCEGYDFRCVGATGACGCWRHDHTFPANVVCNI